jgi:acetyltransferase-like isoleucine patch superfamily enzyme
MDAAVAKTPKVYLVGYSGQYRMRTQFKKIANGVFMVLILPLLVIYKIFSVVSKPDSTFWAFSQFLSLMPGKSGSYLRKSFYRLAMTNCSPECHILFGTIFAQRDTEIGDGVYIGPNCNIGRSKIEDYCTLGSNVHIMSGKKQHNFDDLDRSIREQGGSLDKVIIGEDSWIGNGALIMANVGKKCIIGAGSVVTKDVEDFSIVAGNPAKLIRKRNEGRALELSGLAKEEVL